jgi:type I restriction enzyme S subunit
MSKLDELLNKYCPNGVPFFSLGQLEDEGRITLGRGNIISKIEMNENPGPYPVYSSSSTNNGSIGTYGKYMFDDERLTWSIDGGGKFFYRNNEKYSVTNVGGWLKVNDKNISTRYLYHVILNEWCKKTFDYVHKAHPSVIRDEYYIPVPPLPIQNEIVSILDNFTNLIDNLSEELEKREEQFDFYREALLNPANYTSYKLKDVVTICLGLTATPNYVDNGVIFISAKDTSKDYLDLSDVKYISEEDYKKATSNAKPKKGDVLFTRVGSNLGHPVIVDVDFEMCMFVSLGFMRVKDQNILLNAYLKHWINSKWFWTQVNGKTYGAAKINLNTGWLNEFDISLPSLEEQKRVVDALRCFEIICKDVKNGLPAEIEARQKQYEFFREKLLSFKEQIK